MNSKQRLELFRKRATKHGQDWRQHRYGHTFRRQPYGGTWTGGHYNCDGFDNFRNVTDAEDVSGAYVKHTGWYTDHYCYDLCKGAVVQLPARKGQARYMPAIYWTGCDGVTVYPKLVTDDKAQAARWADEYAEEAAELDREAAAKDAAEQLVSDLEEGIQSTRYTVRELIQGLKQARDCVQLHLFHAVPDTRLDGAVCRQIWADIKRYRREISKARRRISELNADYWQAVNHY